MSDEANYPTMTGAKALSYIAEMFGITSKYAVAKALSDDKLTVQSIQLSNYSKGRKMSKKVAKRFFDTYGIIISDVDERGTLDIRSRK